MMVVVGDGGDGFVVQVAATDQDLIIAAAVVVVFVVRIPTTSRIIATITPNGLMHGQTHFGYQGSTFITWNHSDTTGILILSVGCGRIWFVLVREG